MVSPCGFQIKSAAWLITLDNSYIAVVQMTRTEVLAGEYRRKERRRSELVYPNHSKHQIHNAGMYSKLKRHENANEPISETI